MYPTAIEQSPRPSDTKLDGKDKYPVLPSLDVKTFATGLALPSTIPITMPPPLGAPFNAAPPGWVYPDQRLPSLGGGPTSVDLSHPSQPTRTPIITIFDVAPQQGYGGTPVRITCDLKFPPSPVGDHGDTSGNRIRLVFGSLAVETTVTAPINHGENYVVSALAPPLQQAAARGNPSWSVPILLEAIAEPFGVLEHVNLGEFHYLGDGSKFYADPDPLSRPSERNDDKVYVMACLNTP